MRSHKLTLPVKIIDKQKKKVKILNSVRILPEFLQWRKWGGGGGSSPAPVSYAYGSTHGISMECFLLTREVIHSFVTLNKIEFSALDSICLFLSSLFPECSHPFFFGGGGGTGGVFLCFGSQMQFEFRPNGDNEPFLLCSTLTDDWRKYYLYVM